MKKTLNITKEMLIQLYIIENKTVAELATILNYGTCSINRFLKQYEIKKSEEQRRAAIAKTKQNKTDEEKQLYAQHMSEARKGKGLGIEPWNKGKTGLQEAWNKGIIMSEEFCDKVKSGLANMSEEKKQLQSQHMSEVRKGRTVWNAGLKTGPWSDDFKQEILAKQYATKKANKSFNSSSQEDLYYETLCDIYGVADVIRQYQDSRYPFICDFYIKSIDTFIELNFSWTHGGQAFDPANIECQAKLALWKEKAINSDYYKNAIETWTVRDVNKLATARKNNLNYIVYYSEDEISK